jgi:hypothetical protein
MPTTDSTTPATKTCRYCGRTLPIDQFRRRRAGQETRVTECRECYNLYMAVFRRSRRLKHIAGFNAAIRREFDLRKVTALCNALLSRLGGLDKFCTLWKAHLDAAPPGSRAALDSFLAVLRLVEIADTKRRSSLDLPIAL